MAWDDIPEWAAAVTGSLLQAVKEKDHYTFYHCLRVGRGSRRLAKAMGLNPYEQAALEFSGVYHDVGKVGIPDHILLKPGSLLSHEIDLMKSHPEKSALILEPFHHIAFFRFLVPGVRYHHEKVDGTGYPFGLVGEQIPLFARIISVVDTYDAMSHARPYREPIPEEKVLKELKDFSDRQFDSQIVKVFLESLPHWKKEDTGKVEEAEVAVSKILKAA